MPTVTIKPEHVDGLRYLLGMEFESACDTVAVKGRAVFGEPVEGVDRFRDLIAFGDQLGWNEGDRPTDEIQLPESLLEMLLTRAREAGYELMADVHSDRAHPDRAILVNPEFDERNARSMLAFLEDMGCREAEVS